MLGLTLLLSRFFQGGRRRPGILALALFLVVWAPWGIWQQVYSWSAAWANYLAPTLLLLPLLLLAGCKQPEKFPHPLVYLWKIPPPMRWPPPSLGSWTACSPRRSWPMYIPCGTAPPPAPDTGGGSTVAVVH